MKRKPKPDTRLKWNSKDLKILHRNREYKADEFNELCKMSVDVRKEPNYKNDPTYDLKVKRDKPTT